MRMLGWLHKRLQSRREPRALVLSRSQASSIGANDEIEYAVVQGHPRILTEIERLILENARNNWLAENWEQLASLSKEDYQNHPERAKLALLNAAGHFQAGSVAEARDLISLALIWGVGRDQLKKVLIGGMDKSIIYAKNILKNLHLD